MKDPYKTEVQARWGETAAYAEYSQKNPDASAAVGMDAIFDEFAQCMAGGEAPQSDKARTLVKKLQSYITAHFYTCTDEILAQLGQIYAADARFMSHIDGCAEGTAAFVSQAIAAYCHQR